ncbi:MAG: DUF1287 domain-containing protein [Methylococcales bacterium]|jgi:uncharacterized protein|nr:DUF1287 domain-containing protein [Methylococcales bacterium]MBT7445283.1 DUF1287 domain-containing protein [Methylococcales bacterium]
MKKVVVVFFLFSLLNSVGVAANFAEKLSTAAIERTTHFVIYNGAYTKIDYPGGDVPAAIGVCTDVVIRSYRALNIDLQKEVHEDMKANFSLYPKIWGLTRTDTNIDHRRVPNLRVFFKRHGASLPVTNKASDYLAGDVVSWVLSNNMTHIGVVVDRKSEDGLRPMVVHNIGLGPQLEDMLFDYTITGHYRYFPGE